MASDDRKIKTKPAPNLHETTPAWPTWRRGRFSPTCASSRQHLTEGATRPSPVWSVSSRRRRSRRSGS